MSYLSIHPAKIRLGTPTRNVSTDKSQAASIPGTQVLPGRRQRGKAWEPWAATLPWCFLHPARPGSRTPAELHSSDATQVLSKVSGPKGLCVLCRLRSLEPSGLQHSALTWPTANVAAAFVTTASFCFFFFFFFIIIYFADSLCFLGKICITPLSTSQKQKHVG